MSNPFFSPESIDTELHREWERERTLRHRVRLDETWRGCIGLALLLARPDDTEYHGSLALVRNEQLTWVALRDVPVGHFPGSPAMDRRDVHYANTAVAELRHGMPVLDFRRNVRDAVDFRFMPFAPHLRKFGAGPWDVELVRPGSDTLDSAAQPREFAVLNALSAKMTRFAFGAVDAAGQPVRPPWAHRRLAEMEVFHPPQPSTWMPRPYLAFPVEVVERLFWLATASATGDTAWECPSCHRSTNTAMFRTAAIAKLQLLESGDFIASCVHCVKRRKWFLDDGQPCRVRRRFPLSFQEQFCRDVANGLQAFAIGPEVYCGTVSQRDLESVGSRHPSRIDLVAHRLRSELDGRSRVVYLPRTAHVQVKPGQRIEAGESWAHVTGPATRAWNAQGPVWKWRTLQEPCGGPGWVGFLQRLWFDHQMVRLAAAPGQVSLPADLVDSAVREAPPVGLWWDTAPAMPHYNWETQAATFPPMRLRRWDALQFALPGDVAVDASVADPRFSARGLTLRRRKVENSERVNSKGSPIVREQKRSDPVIARHPARLAG